MKRNGQSQKSKRTRSNVQRRTLKADFGWKPEIILIIDSSSLEGYITTRMSPGAVLPVSNYYKCPK